MAGQLQPPDDVHVFDKNNSRMALYCKRWPGMHSHKSAASCVEGADVVLLAVKPQHMAHALSDIAPALSSSALVVSIAAGCPISMFADALPTNSICRSMPNTPAMIGRCAIAARTWQSRLLPDIITLKPNLTLLLPCSRQTECRCGVPPTSARRSNGLMRSGFSAALVMSSK
jgi:hypothetical protein